MVADGSIGDTSKIHFLEVNNVCDGGSQLLSTFRAMRLWRGRRTKVCMRTLYFLTSRHRECKNFSSFFTVFCLVTVSLTAVTYAY